MAPLPLAEQQLSVETGNNRPATRYRPCACGAYRTRHRIAVPASRLRASGV